VFQLSSQARRLVLLGVGRLSQNRQREPVSNTSWPPRDGICGEYRTDVSRRRDSAGSGGSFGAFPRHETKVKLTATSVRHQCVFNLPLIIEGLLPGDAMLS
jgi:hypothetical protein